MDINKAFPNTSDYLKKEDLPKPVKVKIESVDLADFKDDKGNQINKLVIKFQGKDKALVCNKTNARTIGAIHGNDTDDWIGKEITMFNDPTVMMGDNQVGGIRIQYLPPGTDDFEDDIPF